MEIKHLREFAYLAETLNYGVSAKHFYLSPGALSKHISSMEKELGTLLFKRDKHGTVLTEAGSRFYTNVIKVLSDFDRALDEIQPDHVERKVLKVGYLRGAAGPFLAKFVHFIESNYPQIDLRIICMEYGELLHAHRSHVVDAIICMELDLEVEAICGFAPVYTDHIYAVVGKEHPYAMRQSLVVDDFSEKKLILPGISPYAGYAQRCEGIVRGARNMFVWKRYEDVDTLFFWLADGESIGFSSGHNCRMYSGVAKFLPVADIDTSYEVGIRWLRQVDKELIDALEAAARACAVFMKKWSDGVAH